ncbi:MAG: hypothetical protein JWO80_4351 [Bryobacterales bacterium]|nr:hypothetical protein [Bryobacterales bacterium]
MAFYFRRSARLGPFRLNFSKSGIGASIGVTGARITMNARGTTYVTVGGNGFYYRETLSNPGRTHVRTGAPPSVPEQATADDRIANADISDLVDSSSERLVQQLNERAKMFNPAWILYCIAAALSFSGLAMLPNTEPSLPSVARPFSVERKNNTRDEYAMLVARYGNPDSILSQPSDSDGLMVARRTARYFSANVEITFVPNGCVDSYEKVMRILAENPSDPALAQDQMRRIEPCIPSPNSGWTIVGFMNSSEKWSISADTASVLLDNISVKRTADPSVETASSPGKKKKTSSGSRTKKQQKPNAGLPAGKKQESKSDIQLDKQHRASEEPVLSDAKAAQRRGVISVSLLLLMGLCAMVAGVLVHKKNMEKRHSRLIYKLDEAEKRKFALVQQAIAHLARCDRIWRIESRSLTSDWKRNAGASSLVRRSQVAINSTKPPRLEANVPVNCVSVGTMRLFFLPDLILCVANGRYGSISYLDFQVEQGVTRFIEEEGVPGDATVVDRTWRFVNKGGGPDRRFNNNVQLPIAQYGMLLVGSSTGLNIHLNTSSAEQSAAFARCWRELRLGNSPPKVSKIYLPPPRRENRDISSTPKDRALDVLGLSHGASGTEITAAYHRLAQMYHPDKVAGLAPEFQELANSKMQEINAAHQLLQS